RHTRLVSDWSSDVCSSDLLGARGRGRYLVVERERHRAPELAIELGELVGELVADDHLLAAPLPARIGLATGLHLERDRRRPDKKIGRASCREMGETVGVGG